MFVVKFSLKKPRSLTRFKHHNLFNTNEQRKIIEGIADTLGKRLHLFGEINVTYIINKDAYAKGDTSFHLFVKDFTFDEDISYLPDFQELVNVLLAAGIPQERIRTSVPLPPQEMQAFIEKCAILSLMDHNLSELLQVSYIDLQPDHPETVKTVILPGSKDAQIDLQTNYVNEKQKAFEALEIPTEWLPDNFFCIISTELMDYPVRLDDNKLINSAALMTHWVRSKTNPFTNLEITESDIHYDWALEEQIDNFLINATRIKEEKGTLTQEDVQRALTESSALYGYQRKERISSEAILSLTLAKRHLDDNHYQGAEQLLSQGLSKLQAGEYRVGADIHFYLHIIYQAQKNAKAVEQNFTNALKSLGDRTEGAVEGLIILGQKFILESDYIKADICLKKAVISLNSMLDDKVGKAPVSEVTRLDDTLQKINKQRKLIANKLPVSAATTIQRFWRSKMEDKQAADMSLEQNGLTQQ